MSRGRALTRAALRRWGPTLLVAAVLAAVGVQTAAAHADLIGSEPAAGSTVQGSPGTIRLSFSQPLESTSTLQLFTGQFQPVTGLAISVAGSELQALVGQPLAPAIYTVQWTAVTDDGHTVEGSFQFGVAAANPSPIGRLAPSLVVLVATLGVGATLLALGWRRRRT